MGKTTGGNHGRVVRHGRSPTHVRRRGRGQCWMGEGPGNMECILAGDGASEYVFEGPVPNGTGWK